MAIKHVQETLGQFEDWKYFSLLESKKEGEDFSDDDKKLAEEDLNDGLDVIKKLQDNLERFKAAAGDKILKYKEFWEENQEATGGFDEEGELYKLWDSNYVAGVLNLPDEALTDDELNAAIEDVDDDSVDLEDDEKEEEGEEEEEKEEEDEDKEEEDEDKEEDEEEDDEEELEEGNAFGGALKKAKKEGKKDFKVGGKKFPVKESLLESEEFEFDSKKPVPLNEELVIEKYRKLLEAKDEEEEGELPAEDVVTPEEETPEEKEETDAEGFTGFEAPGEDLDGDGIEGEGEVEVEDGEAVELEDDLDGDGAEEGGMEFGEEGGMNDYFVVYDMNGDRDEVFRTDSPKVIEAFKDFFENQFKATIRETIQKFKQAQEEKKREAERAAKEAIRAERKAKLDKFMKD